MSLTKQTKPKLNQQQIKRGGAHHRKTNDYHKAYWPYLPVLVVVLAGFLVNTLWMKTGVMDYAIDTAPATLLSSTNYERTSNNLSALSINASLSEAAQAKALDMVNRNYWSHNTPDNKEPWVFIASTGYKYQTAGENLAFGFPTSSDTVLAWMNSPGHRANILNNSYTEVGFGIANSQSYREYGNQTIVVAMYASPAQNLVADNTKQQNTPAVAPSIPPAGNSPVVNTGPATANETVTAKPTTAVAAAASPQKISRVEVAFTGVGPWSVTAVVVLVVALGAMLIMRHGLAWKRALVHGEQFILHHKMLDVVVVAVIVSGVLLVQTVGFIQ